MACGISQYPLLLPRSLTMIAVTRFYASPLVFQEAQKYSKMMKRPYMHGLSMKTPLSQSAGTPYSSRERRFSPRSRRPRRYPLPEFWAFSRSYKPSSHPNPTHGNASRSTTERTCCHSSSGTGRSLKISFRCKSRTFTSQGNCHSILFVSRMDAHRCALFDSRNRLTSVNDEGIIAEK